MTRGRIFLVAKIMKKLRKWKNYQGLHFQKVINGFQMNTGGGNGFEFSDCEMMNSYKQRFSSMPNEFVMIYWCDEYGYCLDTNNLQDGECSVVNWSPFESAIYLSKPNFYEFFLNEIENAIDNNFWDE